MTKTRGMVGSKLGKKCGHFILILKEVAEYFLVTYFFICSLRSEKNEEICVESSQKTNQQLVEIL